jgi:hypothetical protein
MKLNLDLGGSGPLVITMEDAAFSIVPEAEKWSAKQTVLFAF